jgi:hypothetical protein
VSAADPRLRAAGAILAEWGLSGVELRVEGHAAEIGSLRVPASAWERLAGEEGARLAEALKGLGLRYVALDLEPLE